MKISAVVAAVGLALALVVALVAMATPAVPSAIELDAATFKVDRVHSSIVFKIRHNGVSNFYGRFNEFAGTFTFDPDDLAAASFDISVDATSIDTGNANRDKHLRSGDFFNVGDFGKISFKSTDVSKGSKEGPYEMTGELTMLGETKTVTVPLDWFGTVESERMGVLGGFEAVFTIKRSDFGMNYGIEHGALGDEVTLIVALEGKKLRPTPEDSASE